ncbi:MAG: GyrI-like domain-containing protein [Elusimicrobia bacterium]|nr:GyrI-like domain-containing protein [Elusimicrobiota bacterium]
MSCHTGPSDELGRRLSKGDTVLIVGKPELGPCEVLGFDQTGKAEIRVAASETVAVVTNLLEWRPGPTIETLREKKLVGMHLTMSLAQDKTGELWKRFMPRRAEIKHRVDDNFISMEFYTPDAPFEKWAVVEVSAHADIPDGMEPYTLRGGQYVVFKHKGPARAAPNLFSHLFSGWLPKSGHALEDREHFELLPKDYRPDDPNAQEEIWIPIK